MNNGLTNFDPVVTMNSVQIAELVEARHDSVKRAIERLAEKSVIALPPMVDMQIEGGNNRTYTTQVHVFRGEQGKRDSIIVVAQLSPEFTARLVDRWQELEAQAPKPTFQIPQTLGEALRLAADLEEQRAALEIENAEKAKLIEYHRPDVAFAEAVRASDDLISLDAVAKTLSKIKQIGPIQLRNALKASGILRKDGLPIQKHINNGLLAVVTTNWTTPEGDVKVNHKTMATGAGLQALTEWYSKYVNSNPPVLKKPRTEKE
ncbi:phage antirepressor KilAC domain-containing protein [Burkholderia multivorans]|uniref:phage antirepressor KilAC domain-containing protein n=1 Tax=Burkholderia multivorans TaxID=87883 RepID=UPI001C2637AB|nr:phage antirepressor KilAC domain-containing protein [Burkholderia multivorans]MBU9526159.1 phage antirepressor KilAC domain-containing protein [Burkholderia multivorans]